MLQGILEPVVVQIQDADCSLFVLELLVVTAAQTYFMISVRCFGKRITKKLSFSHQGIHRRPFQERYCALLHLLE